MELKHIISKDEERKSVTLLLYGYIGGSSEDKIDGDYFAKEIDYLGKEYDEIIIRINSGGGEVLQGLSIFNAIMQSPAYTVCQVDGVAASMAGVILFAANKITMNDFGRIMLHNPYYPGMDEAKLSKKELKALENLSGMLVSLVKKRCKDQDVETMLSEETWLTAKDARKIGIVDEIIDTGKFNEVENALSGIAAVSDINYANFLFTQKDENNMKVIAGLFGLEATATESDIVNEVKALQLENTALKNKQKELQTLADGFKAQIAEARKKEIETLADGAITAGYFDKDQRDNLIALGEANFDTFKGMIDKLKPATASLTEVMNAAVVSDDTQGKEVKDYLWFSKNDPEALVEMKTLEPDRYKKLEAEYEKKYC